MSTGLKAKNLGEVTISLTLVISLIGGVAITIYSALTYVNAQIQPIQTQTQSNTTAITAMQAQSTDSNQKINKLYDYFFDRGINTK